MPTVAIIDAVVALCSFLTAFIFTHVAIHK